MIIYLDSSQKENSIYLLDDKAILVKYFFTTDYNSDSQLLAEFDKFLTDNGAKLKDLNVLKVNLGPGSFTGTRNGITLANAFKLANPTLKLVGLSNPDDQQIVDSKEFTEILTPIYLKNPNITESKKHT